MEMPLFGAKMKLPKYGVTDALRPHLINYIVEGNFKVGDRFHSDAELVEAVGKCRTTVRKTLNQLQKEGWIERRSGVGTFVGPRVALERNKGAGESDKDISTDSDSFSDHESFSDQSGTTPTRIDIPSPAKPRQPFEAAEDRRILRVAVVWSGFLSPGELRERSERNPDSVLPFLLGFESSGAKSGVVMELMNSASFTFTPKHLAARFDQQPPDALVCCGPPVWHSAIIGKAQQRSIPVMMAMYRGPGEEFPTIYEDGKSSAIEVVEHLHSHGHERIAFVQSMSNTGWWVFDRYEGYREGIERCGLPFDEGLVTWLPSKSDGYQAPAILDDFIQRQKPTAIIFGCRWACSNIQTLTEKGRYSAPEDISVVTFDRHPDMPNWFQGKRPTCVELPYYETGRHAAELAKRLVHGESVDSVTVLPCKLVEGETVRGV